MRAPCAWSLRWQQYKVIVPKGPQEKYGMECRRHHCPEGDLSSKVVLTEGMRPDSLSPGAELSLQLSAGPWGRSEQVPCVAVAPSTECEGAFLGLTGLPLSPDSSWHFLGFTLCRHQAVLRHPRPSPLACRLPGVYLQEDPPADHSRGDGLLIVTQALALPQLLVQLLVDVLQHEAQGALDNVHHILTADQEEAEQHQRDQELRDECPHPPRRPLLTSRALRGQGTPRAQLLWTPNFSFSSWTPEAPSNPFRSVSSFLCSLSLILTRRLTDLPPVTLLAGTA